MNQLIIDRTPECKFDFTPPTYIGVVPVVTGAPRNNSLVFDKLKEIAGITPTHSVGDIATSKSELRSMGITELAGIIGVKPDYKIGKKEYIEKIRSAQIQSAFRDVSKPFTPQDLSFNQLQNNPKVVTVSQTSPKPAPIRLSEPVIHIQPIGESTPSSGLPLERIEQQTPYREPTDEEILRSLKDLITRLDSEKAEKARSREGSKPSGNDSSQANTTRIIAGSETVKDRVAKPISTRKPILRSLLNSTQEAGSSFKNDSIVGWNVLSPLMRDKVTRGVTRTEALASKLYERSKRMRKTRMVGSMALLAVAAWSYLPGISLKSNAPDARDTITVEAEIPTTIEAEEITSITTEIESPTTTNSVIPVEALLSTTVSATEVTEVTVEQTTTTIEEPKTVMERLLNGEMTLSETSMVKYATLEAPKLCLTADAYGSQTRDVTDTAVLQYYADQGIITPEQQWVLASGQATKQQEVDFLSLLDPTYKIEPASTPQEDCGTPMNNPKYPARWDRIPQGTTEAQKYNDVANLQPIVAIDKRGAIIGQKGNAVVLGHRTTESAPFANLDQLVVGDNLIMTGDDNVAYTYVVEGAEFVNPTEEGLNQILDYISPSGSDTTLTLYTCDQGGDIRYVVRAILQEA